MSCPNCDIYFCNASYLKKHILKNICVNRDKTKTCGNCNKTIGCAGPQATQLVYF